jgi:hypothetical protein
MKDVMYGSFSCNFKPNKEEKECTRLTVGGNRINYPDDCSTPTALAGKVGCRHVKTRVKTTDMCLSGWRVADMLADMSAT